MSELASQLVQLPGAALILTAYVCAQIGWLNQKSRLYLLLNAVGSAALAINAAWFGQWGFLLLEGSWAIVSLVGLGRLARLARMESVVSVQAVKRRVELDDRDALVS